MKYINNVHFYDGKQMRKRGEVNENPSDAHIRAGLVREVKVEQPTETKRSVKRVAKRSDRKPADQTK